MNEFCKSREREYMLVEGYSINLILEIKRLCVRVKQNLNSSEQTESISQKLNAVADPLKILHGPQFEDDCSRQELLRKRATSVLYFNKKLK